MSQIQRACRPGQDIISELPEEIRLHILTLLPRKYAIRTAVLSSKWKDVWKKRFPHPTNLTFGRATQNEEEQKQLAEEIQLSMDLHGKQRIETFNLYFYPGRNHQKMAAGWLEQAETNGVEEFLLDFSQAGMGSYPRKQLTRRAKKFEMKENLFKFNTALTSFTLSYCRLQRYFKFKYFSCLETLCLRRVNINDFMFGRLVSNCPRLESLELTRCYYVKHIKIPASLNMLKKLTIACCWATEEIHLSAPMLRTFHFFGDYPHSFVLLDNMPFLCDVILMSPIRLHQWLSFRRFSCSFLVMWFDQVQVLTLCNMCLSVMFEMRPPTLISFIRLKELQLLMNIMIDRDINNLFRLFQYCPLPLLERLYVELPASCCAYDTTDESKFQKAPIITFQHLKMLKMNNFKGLVNELMLLDFLLRSASNLEHIILVFPHQFYTDATDVQRVDVFYSVVLMQELAPRAQIVMYYSYHHQHHGFTASQSNAVQDFQQLQAEIKDGV